MDGTFTSITLPHPEHFAVVLVAPFFDGVITYLCPPTSVTSTVIVFISEGLSLAYTFTVHNPGLSISIVPENVFLGVYFIILLSEISTTNSSPHL